MLLRKLTVRCTAIAAICLVMFIAPLANAQASKDILKHVPDDAWGLVTLKSLANLDAKVAQLDSVLQMGIPAPAGMALMTMPALAMNVDMTKPVAIIVMDIQKYGQMNANEAFVLLVPAKDPKMLIEGLALPTDTAAAEPEGEDAKAEKKVKSDDGIITISIMGQTGYAVVKDKYVLLGQSKDCLKAVAKPKAPMAKSFGEARSKVLDESDLHISIALGVLVEQYKDTFMPMMQMMMAASDPTGESVKAVEKTLTEMHSGDIAVKLNDKGVTLQFLASPKPGSDLEKLMKDTKNLDKSLLAMLPKEKYLFCMGAVTQYSEHAEKFGGGQAMFSQLAKSIGLVDVDEEASKILDKELLKMQKEGGPSAVAISYLPEGKNGIFGVTMVTKPRSAKNMVAGFRKIYETIWKVSDDEDLATFKNNIVHTPDAETLAGSKVDTLTFQLTDVADMLELEDEDIDQIKKVFGENITVRFGAVGEHFVLTFGGGAERFEQVAKGLSDGTGLDTDAGIKEVGKMLPMPRAQEMYLAADNIVECIKAFAKAVGEEDPIPGEFPRVDAPVAIGIAQNGSTMQLDLVVPMKLIKAGKAFYDKQSAAAMDDFESDDMDMDDDSGDDMDDDNDDDDM